jgi:hypothetical protein
MFVLLAVVTLVLASCDGVGFVGGEKGSGNLVTESRDVDTFSSIEASGAINVELTVDPGASHTVTVTYDDNILDNVITRVAGDTLVLELDGSLNLTGNADRVVVVTMPDLAGIEASGASGVHGSGSASTYSLDASGASRVDVRDLEAIDIDVDVSGASDVDLFATGTVRGEVSGASDVKVYGKPISVLIDSSGASTVDIVD